MRAMEEEESLDRRRFSPVTGRGGLGSAAEAEMLDPRKND